MLEVLVAAVSTIDTKLLSPNHLSSGVPLSTLAFQSSTLPHITVGH